MVEKKSPTRGQIETITHFKPKKTKSRTNIMERQSKAKTFYKWLQASIILLEKDKNIIHAEFLKSVLNKYNEFEEHEKVVLDAWKGKSGLEFIRHPKGFTVVRHQKIEKDGKPEQFLAELDNMEVNLIIKCLNELTGTGIYEDLWIPTRDLGEYAYRESWDAKIFSNRKKHHKLTFILNLLEQYGFTEYSRSGKSRLTKKIKDVEDIKDKK